MSHAELAVAAAKARRNAYAPYSRFAVGAALLCEDGTVFTGANVENASFSLTCCGERSALFAAVSSGRRRFAALAVLGAPIGEEQSTDYTLPCGACLQALSEFCTPDMPVLCAKSAGDFRTVPFGELFPAAFSL